MSPPVAIEPGTLGLRGSLLCCTLMLSKLTQSGKHQSGSQEVSSSIPTRDNNFGQIYFALPEANLHCQFCQLCIIKGKFELCACHQVPCNQCELSSVCTFTKTTFCFDCWLINLNKNDSFLVLNRLSITQINRTLYTIGFHDSTN